MPSALDLSPLRSALAQLREALVFWTARDAGDPLKPHLRSAVIQSFEFSYELSVRLARRVLMQRAVAADLVADLGFNDLVRKASDAGLPMPLDTWRGWRDMRNGTSHAYSEQRAQAVADEMGAFLADAECLLAAMEHMVAGESL